VTAVVVAEAVVDVLAVLVVGEEVDTVEEGEADPLVDVLWPESEQAATAATQIKATKRAALDVLTYEQATDRGLSHQGLALGVLDRGRHGRRRFTRR